MSGQTAEGIAASIDPFVSLWERIREEQNERRSIDAAVSIAKASQVVEKAPAQVTAVDKEGGDSVMGFPVNKTLLKIGGGLLLAAAGLFIYKKMK